MSPVDVPIAVLLVSFNAKAGIWKAAQKYHALNAAPSLVCRLNQLESSLSFADTACKGKQLKMLKQINWFS